MVAEGRRLVGHRTVERIVGQRRRLVLRIVALRIVALRIVALRIVGRRRGLVLRTVGTRRSVRWSCSFCALYPCCWESCLVGVESNFLFSRRTKVCLFCALFALDRTRIYTSCNVTCSVWNVD